MSNSTDPNQGPLYWAAIGVVAFVCMIVTYPWWSGEAVWKIAVAGGASGLIGSAVGRWIMAKLAKRKG